MLSISIVFKLGASYCLCRSHDIIAMAEKEALYGLIAIITE